MWKSNYSIASGLFAMIFFVAASNHLVLYPINDWFTWGALTYPATFLVTELITRFHGPKIARKIAFLGFIFAVLCSIWVATPRIAFASGTAFLAAQLLDIFIFVRLRQLSWWCGPLLASFSASFVDSGIFWTLAFYGEPLSPYLTWTIGDFSIKFLIDIILLFPYRLAVRRIPAAV